MQMPTSIQYPILLHWLVSAILGVAMTLSYYARFAEPHLTAALDRWAVLLYFVPLFTVASYFLLFRWLAPRLARVPRRHALRWAAAALAASAVLLALVLPRPTPPQPHQLEVRATGQKSAGAKGSEVWLIGLYPASQQPVSPGEFQHEPGWSIKDGKLVFSGTAPASARWSGAINGDADLQLVSHPWSGIVEITWDGQTQTIDLFNADADVARAIPLSASRLAQRTPYDWLVAFADLLSLGLLLLAAGLGFAALRSEAAWRRGRRGRLLALAALLTLPPAALIAPVIFAGPDETVPLRPVDHLLAWLYCLFALGVATCLWTPEGRLRRLVPSRLPQRLRWLAAELWGQTAGAWLAALAASALVAAVLVGRLGVGAPQALWVRLALDAPAGQAPAVILRYGDAPGDTVPFRWQPYDQTLVAVRPLDGAQSVSVRAVETDAGPLDLATVQASSSALTPAGLELASPQGTLLRWEQPSRAITLTLNAGAGRAEVLWLDQRVEVSLAQPAPLALALPAAAQGWALLPPRAVRQLALELPAPGVTYAIRGLTVPAASPDLNLLWGVGNAAAWQTSGCAAQPGAASLAVSALGDGPCTVRMPVPASFNAPNRSAQAAAWLAIVALLVCALRALLWVSAAYRRWTKGYRTAYSRFGGWLRARSRAWSPRWVMLAVWLLSLALGLLYAFSVPFRYMYDSLDYLSAARGLANVHTFSGMIGSIRTPGYPAFLAATVALFGTSALAIVLAQHLALSALAPLTVWALHRRLTLIPSAVIGALVACSPTLRASANTLLSELCFTVVAASALLVFARYGGRARGLIIVGALAGAAAMVRPTGLLLLAVFLGWMALRAWCGAVRARQPQAMAGCVALVAGYLAISAPWHLHLAAVRKTADLSQGLAGFTAWAGAVYQRRVTGDLPANQPDRALWSMIHTWSYDAFAALSQPQFLSGPGVDRSTYFAQALREANSINRSQFVEVLGQAGLYNLTLRYPAEGSPYVYWRETSDTLGMWEAASQPRQPPIGDPVQGSIQQQLEQQIDRSYQHPTQLRALGIGLSRFVLGHWFWLTLPALLCLPLLLASAALRPHVPAWLFWIALVASTSAISFPAERYMIVVEPLLYVLVVAPLTMLACVRYQKRRPALYHLREAELQPTPQASTGPQNQL